MNPRIILLLTGLATLMSVNIPVFAQVETQSPSEDFTLRGDSLLNINNRSADFDFQGFFESHNNQGLESSNSEDLPWSQSIFRPSNPVFLQPASQDVNGNDGLQLQLDLSAEE
jgi:hypothetical protein